METKTYKHMNTMEMSPFTVHNGEEVVHMPANEYCHFISLNELQQQIILAVNQFLVLNCHMIGRYLEKTGVNISSKYLKNQVKLLTENGYLQKMDFYHEGEIQSCKAYAVSRKGKGWLSAAGHRIRLDRYILQCDVLQLKKILAANQVMIELADADMLKKANAGQIILYKRENSTKKTKYIFRAYSFATYEQKTYIVQPFRGAEGIDDVKSKLKRIDAVLKYGMNCNIPINVVPTVIVTAESKYQMEWLMEEIKRCRYKNFNLAFTYDRAVLESEEMLFVAEQKSFAEWIFAKFSKNSHVSYGSVSV